MAPPTDGTYRFARFVLAFSMLTMGACGIVYEYALGVLGNNLMGSSHEQIFVVIGLMMFAMGLAAALQKHVRTNLVDAFIGIELALALVGGASAMVIFATFALTTSHAIVLYGFAIVIGLLIGLEIPILIRINEEYARTLRANLSDILCMDYVGALLGALLFTYVLLSRVSIGRMAAVLGLTNALLALIGLVYFWRLARYRGWLLAGLVVVVGSLATLAIEADRWTASLEQRCYEDPIIHAESSVYQRIVMTKRGDRLNLYLNGHLQFSSRDERIYHEMLTHVPLNLARRRARVLILGGGDGLALREVLRFPGVEHVTLVDLDPRVVALASTHPELVRLNEGSLSTARVEAAASDAVTAGAERTIARRSKLARRLVEDDEYEVARVRVMNIDADLFVRRLGSSYDVAILDFPDPRSPELGKLYSVDFYRTLAERLSADALIAVQSSSPVHAKRAFRCIGETLRTAGLEALPYQAHVPSFGQWGWHLAWKRVRGRSDGPTPAAMRDAIARRFGTNALAVPTRHVTAALILGAFAFEKGALEGTPVDANTKSTPVIERYYRTPADG